MASGDLRRDVRFVHRLVREHRLADDVPDGEDVANVGAHLLVDRNEAAVGNRHTGLIRVDVPAVRAAANRNQHGIVDLRLRRRFGALESDFDAGGCRLGGNRLGLQHDVVEAARVFLLPYFDQIAVSAGHHAVQHFDDIDARAKRRIDGRHFEPDDAATDHQHALGDRFQLQRTG